MPMVRETRGAISVTLTTYAGPFRAMNSSIALLSLDIWLRFSVGGGTGMGKDSITGTGAGGMMTGVCDDEEATSMEGSELMLEEKSEVGAGAA